MRIHILGYVAGNLIQILVWWLFTPEQHFWPVWSILGWGAGLVAHIWTVRATAQKFIQS
ncbi:2TM domain-containing protein [Micromonospora sp. NPDC050397]|uniref:2TM domain-containing protein n=1 Tax=Micromonospora sp. NPDC050397 TaxID=3364279 RepID=UPI00384F424D